MLLIVLFSILTSCNQTMDLENLTLTENINDFSEFLNIKNTKSIDLLLDYKFLKIEDSGEVERNKGRIIKDIYIDPSNNKVTYNNIIPNELMFRTIDNIIAYYHMDIYDAESTNMLFDYLEKKYGKGKLIFGEDNNGSQIYIWKIDNKFIRYSTIIYTNEDKDGNRVDWLGSSLVMVDANELLKGTCPLYTSMLKQIKMPDLRE